MWTRRLATLAPFLVATCGRNPRETNHPTSENLADAVRIVNVRGDTQIAELGSVLRQRPVVTARLPEAFRYRAPLGVILPDSSIVLAATGDAPVWHLTRGGSVIPVASANSRPLPVGAVHGLATAGDGVLWVLDSRRSVRRWRWQGQQWTELGVHDFGRRIDAICRHRYGGVLFSLDPDDRLLHWLDTATAVLASAGGAYRSHDRFVRRQLSRGRLACGPDDDRTAFAALHVAPVVRAMRRDGTLLWASLLPDYIPQPTTSSPTPVSTLTRKTVAPFDELHSLVLWNAGTLLVTVRRVSALIARSPKVTHQVYIVDPRTGATTEGVPMAWAFLDVRMGLLLAVDGVSMAAFSVRSPRAEHDTAIAR